MIRTSMTRVMLTMAGVAAVVALLAGMVGHAPLARALQSMSPANRADSIDSGARIVPPSATSLSPDQATPDEDATSKTDFEGDEVSPAVATYGIDREGNLFEVHSPQTEVPKLPGPTI